MALLVREAVSQYVAKNTSEVAGLPSFVAMGKSGHRDTAERHEELLFKDLVPGAAVAPVRRPAKGRRRV